jgi:hypothetical protein
MVGRSLPGTPGATPSKQGPPPEVVELARRRDAARTAREYGRADQLRQDLAALGWEVADGPAGSTLAPVTTGPEVFDGYASVPALAGRPAACRHSLCIAYHGWPEDVRRLLGRLVDTAGDRRGELEVVLGAGAATSVVPVDLGQASHPVLSRPPVIVIVGQELGHAQMLNVAARRAQGELLHFVEPSLEFGWEVLESAAGVLEDAGTGACGPLGLVTEDWREFQPSDSTEVMAFEYLISIRRADVARIGEMDPGFRFYRNLDLDYSRQVVAAGLRLRRYDASLERHAHRIWEATTPAERERLSRRNFNRLLDHWARPGGSGS